MAWRIDQQIIRGEIDNRVSGRVDGRLWFVGRGEPVILELKANCWQDLAGRRLEFTNPQPKPGDLGSFAVNQAGVVGDITASRKVKVPDIPMDQIGEYYLRKKSWTWHWSNSLYLEWFGQRNGRVVIESAAFDLKIMGEPAWEMTETEQETQGRANAEAMNGFIERLAKGVSRQVHDNPEMNKTAPAETDQGTEGRDREDPERTR
jgi:hypothetical protein